MNLSEYKNKNRRPITLPSGFEGWIRRPTITDFRHYPALMKQAMGEINTKTMTPEQLSQYWGELHELCSRRCFIPQGGEMTDKEPNLCGPRELSVQDLAPEDVTAIREAVNDWLLEGDGKAEKEAAAAAGDAGFPASPEKPAGDSVPPGEGVRPAAAPAG